LQCIGGALADTGAAVLTQAAVGIQFPVEPSQGMVLPGLVDGMEILVTAAGHAAAGAAEANRKNRLTGPDSPVAAVKFQPAHIGEQAARDSKACVLNGLRLGDMAGQALRLLRSGGTDVQAADTLVVALAVPGVAAVAFAGDNP